MAQPRRRFVDGRYGQMHLRIAEPSATPGTTPGPTLRPLVCLHMFPQSGRNFSEFLGPASTDRIVIAPDFPGYGESDPPAEPIAAADYAASIWDVIDALELTAEHGSVDLFGIHAGAKLATEVARQRPEHINNIVLSSAAVLYDDELAAIKAQMSPIKLDEAGTRFKHLWSMLCNNRATGVTLEMLGVWLSEMIRGGEKYEWGHDAVFEYNRIFPDAISSLPHRIELMNPADDLYEMTPRTAVYLQNGNLHDFPDWGHGFLEVHAEEAARQINHLLA